MSRHEAAVTAAIILALTSVLLFWIYSSNDYAQCGQVCGGRGVVSYSERTGGFGSPLIPASCICGEAR